MAILLPVTVAILTIQLKYKETLKKENLGIAATKGFNVSDAAVSRRKKYGSILATIFLACTVIGIAGILLELENTLYFLVAGFVIFIFGIVGMLIADYAERKGKSWEAFFWLSVLVSPVLTAIVVAVITVDSNALVSGTKKCPMCAEVIKAEAILCKHCGTDLA
jgi:hypothetical protein